MPVLTPQEGYQQAQRTARQSCGHTSVSMLTRGAKELYEVGLCVSRRIAEAEVRVLMFVMDHERSSSMAEEHTQ